ncbi:hypothetical protein LTR17_000022 [Elasticomyces elasticus]|nr:hypothetical protein LTR17_000022 [Elasticomyces elasticus]
MAVAQLRTRSAKDKTQLPDILCRFPAPSVLLAQLPILAVRPRSKFFRASSAPLTAELYFSTPQRFSARTIAFHYAVQSSSMAQHMLKGTQEELRKHDDLLADLEASPNARTTSTAMAVQEEERDA